MVDSGARSLLASDMAVQLHWTALDGKFGRIERSQRPKFVSSLSDLGRIVATVTKVRTWEALVGRSD